MPSGSGTLPGPRVTPSSILFELADPDHALASATVYQEVRRPHLGPAMTRVEGGWSASLPRPPVDRLEYLLVLERGGGRSAWVPDPSNPLRAEGPFGAKSVVEMPGYSSPGWLDGPAPEPPQHSLRVLSRLLGATVRIQIWTSPGSRPGAELPLLVVNDGPEYARFAGLLRFLRVAVRAGRLPSHHAALLQPNRRNEEYSANPAYAKALLAELIPAVERSVRVRSGRAGRVCMGASLGGLAMLHAHLLHPELCAGMYLQSASCFRHPDDDHEGGMRDYPRVVRFVELGPGGARLPGLRDPGAAQLRRRRGEPGRQPAGPRRPGDAGLSGDSGGDARRSQLDLVAGHLRAPSPSLPPGDLGMTQPASRYSG